MQTAYENECLSRYVVMNQHKKCLNGRESIGKVRGDEWQKTATSEVNVNTISVAIEGDRHLVLSIFFFLNNPSSIKSEPQKSIFGIFDRV